MTDKPSLLQETDDEARGLAHTLLEEARYASIAVFEPDTGFPSVSRTIMMTDENRVPVILASKLATHTQGLLKDPRCSLLVGEPGPKGDPLTHPRMTVYCLAERIERDSNEHGVLREAFLARNPKAKLYIDFPDFSFFRLTPQSASMNGGFGRAFALASRDLGR